MIIKHTLSVVALASLALSVAAKTDTFGIETLDLSQVEQGWGSPHRNRSVDNRELSIGGQKFAHGLGTHANSTFRLSLGGKAERFTASVGVDDEVDRQGSVVFRVAGDDKTLWESGVMRGGAPAKQVSVDLTGVKTLLLAVEAAGDSINSDHADWADANIVMTEGKPQALVPPREPAVVLTPKPSPAPRINGPKIFGARPGSPFLFTIPASGQRPMTFAADGLPPGLQLDPATGIITGALNDKGTYITTLTARNDLGAATRPLKILCGDTIALTPAAGLEQLELLRLRRDRCQCPRRRRCHGRQRPVEHGWTYINIDDCWEAGRDAQGNVLSNAKFPNMNALTEYVHSKGLKIGLYSSPGPKTCAGHEGSYKHEEQDARRYAQWGFDYLKYDWCSYGEIAPRPDHAAMLKPYQVMRAALDKAPRDIVFSLCQYGMGNVWEWGAQVGGNCWRTTGDITDTWRSMAGIGFGQAGHEKFAGPGHWNDPDMLVVGYVGWSAQVRPTRLTPNEQYTHISLWCLLCSPLLIGCDLTKLDEFTLNLLTNDEVLEVSQDPLGRQAGRVAQNGPLEVWAKDMEDGSKAVGLFNRGAEQAQVTANWADLHLTGTHKIRDLWRQQDLGSFSDHFQAPVPRHGVVLIKVAAQ